MKLILTVFIFISCAIFFSKEANAQVYCIPNYTFTPFGCSDIGGGDVIDDFWTTGGISNITNMNTGCNGDYTLFAMTAAQTMGQQITFNMQCGPTFAEGFRIWIDYNNDGDFQDLLEDVWASSAAALTVQTTGAYTIPVVGITPGIKRLRVLCRYATVPLSTDDCNQNMVFGECEDYYINILPTADYDPAVYFISQPAGNCFSSAQTFQVRLKNYGSLPIVLTPTNYITLNLNVNGPSGLVVYDTVLTSGTIPALGADSIVAFFTTPFNNSLNLYAGGTYQINSSMTCTGFANGLVQDDSLTVPIIITNYRPTAGPTYTLCQGSSIPFGQGLSVSGCATPLYDSVTINFTVTPCVDNIGATGFGTSTGAPANCANQFACTTASGILPALPVGAYFAQPARLKITNISSGFPTECRFNLFGAIPDGPTLYSGCQTPYNVGAGDINVGGTTTGPASNFVYERNIPSTSVSAMYSNLVPGNTVNVGYFELWNDFVSTSDIVLNSGGPSIVTLKIYYLYVPPSFEWYDVPSGGSSLYSLSPFNPISVPNSLVNNSNTPGSFVFYAACTGSSNCRIPDTLIIKPAPPVFQDTLTTCENISSSNSAIVDLTSLNNGVSGGFANDSIMYYYDQANISLVIPQNADTTGSIILYSKVFLGQCAASDSVIVNINNKPEIALFSNSPIICAPSIGNVLDYINPFSYSPTGTDTSYYQNAACTQIFNQPYVLTATDSIYIVFATNTTPVCSDTIGMYVDISTSSNLIVNQSNLNISNCSSTDPIATAFKNFSDGQTDDVRNQADCRKIVGIHDMPNGISMGSVAVNEVVDCPDPIYNNLPYLNRHFEITPTTQDSAQVCLYVLDEDIASFNLSAQIGGYQGFLANLSNLCVHKIDNGTITSPQMILTQLDAANSNLTISYDPTYTVYSICFDVANFSYFYCTTCFATPLPVNWSSFTAKRVDNTSSLVWITAQELNSDYFVVERSRDGKNFQAISANIISKAVNGTSETPLTYDFVDMTPLEGHNYYRILQTDKDQKTSYSQVREVYFGTDTKVNIYPNPVDQLLSIDILIAKSTTANIQVLDATGRIVKQMNSTLAVGNNTLSMDVQDLADGVYLIKITNDKGLNYSETIRKK